MGLIQSLRESGKCDHEWGDWNENSFKGEIAEDEDGIFLATYHKRSRICQKCRQFDTEYTKKVKNYIEISHSVENDEDFTVVIDT